MKVVRDTGSTGGEGTYDYTECYHKILTELSEKRRWAYDPEYKRWYSPDDFRDIFHPLRHMDTDVSRFQLRDPMEGIEAGYRYLEVLRERLLNLTNRVVRSYQEKKDA